MDKYHQLPQPDELTDREKEDAMGAYLMMFASVAIGLPLPVLNLIAAIIYYFVNRSESKFVNYHALHSLYAQIPTSILNGIAVIWVIRTFVLDLHFDDNLIGYLVMVGVVNILYFIFSIIAAMRARKGRFYYFIFFGRLAYHQVFLVRDHHENEIINKPPAI